MIRLIPPYQHEGVAWMKKREANRGGFLCDEMGLGKTVQMLKVMVDNRKPKTLIVVPKSLVNQWESEIKKFTKFSVECFDGPNRSVKGSEICVTSYSILGDESLPLEWDRIVLDEAHFIRNSSTQVYKSVMRFKSGIKWVLTGTPIFNNMKDFVALARFVGLSVGQVQRNYGDICSEFVLRRTKACLRVSIVPCEFENIELEMPPKEKVLYDEVYEDFCNTIKYNSNMMDILEAFLRCRQICVWPQLYYDGIYKKGGEEQMEWVGSTAKIDCLIENIKMHPNEKTLVFTQFTGEANKIRELLEAEQRPVFTLNGSTKDREGVIKEFKKAANSAVFLIQIKTGGVGLNLQEASRVYITHPSWNPATEMQAIARAHRTGQTRVVRIKKLLYVHENSIETEIVELQNAKAMVCAKILNDPSLLTQIPKVHTVSNFIFKIGKSIRIQA
jgi:SNF2 family DNA or RNA helicase